MAFLSLKAKQRKQRALEQSASQGPHPPAGRPSPEAPRVTIPISSTTERGGQKHPHLPPQNPAWKLLGNQRARRGGSQRKARRKMKWTFLSVFENQWRSMTLQCHLSGQVMNTNWAARPETFWMLFHRCHKVYIGDENSFVTRCIQ